MQRSASHSLPGHRPSGEAFRWPAALGWFMLAFAVGMLPVASALYRTDFGDEHYYAIAAIRVSLGERPYFDHVNVQSPLHALVGGALLAATGTATSPTGGLLLRLLTAASEVITLIALASTARHVSPTSDVSGNVLLALAAIASSISWSWYGGLIQNTSMSTALICCALALTVGWLKRPEARRPLLISGVMAGLAVSTRLQMAPLSLALALACAIALRRERLQVFAGAAATWVVGFAVGLLPLGAFWVQDPAWVSWCIVQFHVVSGEARQLLGHPTSWGDTALKALFVTVHPTNLAWVAMLLVAASGVWSVKRMPLPLFGLSAAFFAAAGWSAVMPTTTFFYHFLPISIAMWIPFSWVSSRMEAARVRLSTVAGLALFLLAFNTPAAIGGVYWRLADIGGPTLVHRWEQHLAELAVAVDDVDSVESLFPLPLVWLGRRPESVRVMGPFLWRLGDMAPARAVALEVGAHRDSMSDVWAARPPSAVLTWVSDVPTGLENRLSEDYLLQRGKERGWKITHHIGNWVTMRPARDGQTNRNRDEPAP